jgi:hypothetical protein
MHPRSKTTAALVTGALAALALAGCGSSTPSPANGNQQAANHLATNPKSGNKPDICAMFTTTQIEEVLGQPVDPGKPATDVALGCGWIANTSNNSTATILYVDTTMYDQAKKYAPQAGMTATEVSGLGDDAWVQASPSGTGLSLLYVKKGDVAFTISAEIRLPPDNSQAPLATKVAADKQLAAIVLAHL